MRRSAFTLLELCVAIAIVGVLVALVVTGIGYVRTAADRANCLNRVRQLAVAVLNYESVNGRLPPGAISGPSETFGAADGVNHGLWAVLLSHLGEDGLARRYRYDLAFDAPANADVVAGVIRVLCCPSESSDPLPGSPGLADYGPVEVNAFWADIGLISPAIKYEGVMPVNGTVRLSDITDGASQTILLVEAPASNPWCSPSTMTSARVLTGGGRHRLGTNVAMADGSARPLGADLSLAELARLITRAGGD